jgi:hypothetical protein
VPVDYGMIPVGEPVRAPPGSLDTAWLAGQNWLGRILMMVRELTR